MVFRFMDFRVQLAAVLSVLAGGCFTAVCLYALSRVYFAQLIGITPYILGMKYYAGNF